jgi:hypothetical protein
MALADAACGLDIRDSRCSTPPVSIAVPSISTVIAAVVTGKRRFVSLTTYLTTGAVLSLTRAALAFGLWRTTPRTTLGARDDQGVSLGAFGLVAVTINTPAAIGIATGETGGHAQSQQKRHPTSPWS